MSFQVNTLMIITLVKITLEVGIEGAPIIIKIEINHYNVLLSIILLFIFQAMLCLVSLQEHLLEDQHYTCDSNMNLVDLVN